MFAEKFSLTYFMFEDKHVLLISLLSLSSTHRSRFCTELAAGYCLKRHFHPSKHLLGDTLFLRCVFDLFNSESLQLFFLPSNVHTIKHSAHVKHCDWSRTNRQLLTCSYDGTVSLVDFLNQGKVEET